MKMAGDSYMNKRNTLLELWRFFFCVAVLAFHFFSKKGSELFHGGYLGVEFFFIVSGYFTGAYYCRCQEGRSMAERLKSIASYALSRLKRLYPFYLLSLILMLLVRTVINRYYFFDVLRLIKNCFAEFILLQWTPLGNEVLISAGWFVPAVFFGGLFFVIILAFTGKTGGYIIAPLINFFIYRYYFNLIGKIDVIYAYHSVLRGVAGVALGVFIYFLCKHLRSLMDKLSKGGLLSKLSCIFASVIFLCIFIYTSYGRRSKWDFLVIALYGTGLLFLMAGSVKLPEKLDKVFLFMGKITYPVYVFQMPVIEVILALIR